MLLVLMLALAGQGQPADPWDRLLGPVGLCDESPCDSRCHWDPAAPAACEAQRNVSAQSIEKYMPPRLRGDGSAAPNEDKRVPPEIEPGPSDVVMVRLVGLRAYNRAVTHARAGRHKEAISEYGAAIESYPGLPEAHYGMGYSLTMLRHLDQAKIRLEEACRLRPSYLQASGLLTRVNAALSTRRP
jgi:tetratricopeptide (TPR) repeat protein